MENKKNAKNYISYHTVGVEEIYKRYQFNDGDTYLIAEVDFFKKAIIIKTPLKWKLGFMRNAAYWSWTSLKTKAINHLERQYGFTKIIEK